MGRIATFRVRGLGAGRARVGRYSRDAMNEALAQALAALDLAIRLSLPALGAAFAVALVVALLLGFLRVSEPALSALPRALATLLVLAALAPWLAGELSTYTRGLFRALPELTR